MQKEKLSKYKILKIIIISVIIVCLVMCLSAYLIIHNYILKMNIVTSAELEVNEEIAVLDPRSEDIASNELDSYELISEVVESEEPDSPGPDSPEEDIISVEDSIRENIEQKSIPIISDKDVFNILLIGSDSRKVNGNGRSDAMIMISINKKMKTITATSLLRDIYLQVPGKNNNRINAAYAFGGSKLLIDTIEQNFRISIDRYASIDFYAFMDVVDAVGGVTLEVTDKEIPIINRYVNELNSLTGQEVDKDILKEPGTLLLSGKQALGYARNRYIGTDFERTARQRRVLEQVFDKVKDMGLIELNDLLNTMLPQITTSLKEGEIFTMLLSLPSYTGYELKQWSIPVNDSYTFMRIRGMDVIGIDFTENINEIQKRIYNIDSE